MSFDFDRYIQAYNSENFDEEALVADFFSEDMKLDGPDGTHDREMWINILRHSHNGVTEILHPLSVVREGNKIMAEIDVVFTASIDRPDFPVKPLAAGEVAKARFFASYEIKDSKISRLALAWWPATSE